MRICHHFLKEMFKKITRVAWLLNYDGFSITTTWKNVCESIIDHASVIKN